MPYLHHVVYHIYFLNIFVPFNYFISTSIQRQLGKKKTKPITLICSKVKLISFSLIVLICMDGFTFPGTQTNRAVDQ